MNTYQRDIPDYKIDSTTSDEAINPKKSWDARLARIEKILARLTKDPEPEIKDTIPISHIVPTIARELAMIWEAPPQQQKNDQIIAQIKKIQSLSKRLVKNNNQAIISSGVSPQLHRAIIGVAHADLYRPGASPKRGRKANMAAQRLAEAFAAQYPILTGREVGVNADHDFVVTLGAIFAALNFKAKPQSYARTAIKTRAEEAARQQADDAQRSREEIA